MSVTPKIIIAGTNSGVGKTTLATAIMSAFTGQGYRVQPYKVGPDYIDPGYHNLATGMISRNLDCWMLGEDTVREVFLRSASHADLAIIEGVMGLYDGLGSTSFGSTAHMAKLLNAPVILVVDVRSMARSAAASVLGYIKMDPEVNICGVILNRVGSNRHYRMLKEAIEDICRVPVVGWVHRNSEVTLPERHLGLLPTYENNAALKRIEIMAKLVDDGIDLGLLMNLAREAGGCPRPVNTVFPSERLPEAAKIGVVRDKAFNFYYQDSLELLESYGATLVECSPFDGKGLPLGISGLYIGGGFPEMFLEELSKEEAFFSELRRAAASGMPIYAECGGLMFLTRSIRDFDGKQYQAAGIIAGYCQMQKKRAALGYVTATASNDSILLDKGNSLRGHEFHYSTLILQEEYQSAYQLTSWGQESAREDGVLTKNTLASYLHINFAGCPAAAVKFIKSCQLFSQLNN